MTREDERRKKRAGLRKRPDQVERLFGVAIAIGPLRIVELSKVWSSGSVAWLRPWSRGSSRGYTEVWVVSSSRREQIRAEARTGSARD